MMEALTQIKVARSIDFDRRVVESEGELLHGLSIETIQVNIGLRCNLACHHCHVESGPTRKEEMTWETMASVLAAARKARAATLDVTGGAPEMHSFFRRFVSVAREARLNVIVRTNLTILLEAGYEDIPAFFRDHAVRLVASLPCYLESNVDKQRGSGVYQESIAAIQRLNAVGYGIEPGLPLDLVYNPGGPSLPPSQYQLEGDYQRELAARFGLRFTRLLTITNVPIGRFQHDLARQGRDRDYAELLERSFNPATLPGLMCRHQLHVGWDGTMYDCDFNFAIGLPSGCYDQSHIRDFNPETYLRRAIATGTHCFACTAGCGSSCGGALT